MSSYAIGIDLGTTYSCVGVLKDGNVKIIHTDHGSTTMASCVSFTEKERLIGDAAKEQGIYNYQNTVFDVKRMIGRTFKDEAVQKDMKHWPFKVVNVAERCRVQVQHMGKTEIYTPEQLSAMLLSKLKETAEDFLRQEVKDAVITVPAYFNDSQRQATKDAAEIAGLNVLRIINEPTAAGIAYALDERSEGQQNILVYDLGGGTFDVTVMVIQDGNFNVKSTSGDTHLGGADFDSLLVDYCAAEFRKKHGVNISQNPRALRRLRDACEKAKRRLSSLIHTTIFIDSLAELKDFNMDITRGRFQEICVHLFKKTLDSVDMALKDAKMSKSDIDEIILVGGSTRIPGVQKLLMDHFKGKPLNKTVHPDEAVAYGAAVQAALLAGSSSALVRNVVIKDVTPMTLGVDSRCGKFVRVIERNTPLPARGFTDMVTADDYQRNAKITVRQGEHETCIKNMYLGEFTLKGIRLAPKGKVHFDIIMEVDRNGILEVQATERGTQNTGTIRITKNAGYLSKEEITQMIKNEEKNVKNDRVQKLLAQARNALETL